MSVDCNMLLLLIVKWINLFTEAVLCFQNDLKSICQDNLAIIIDCLQSAELQDTFVSKKKSRDLRGGLLIFHGSCRGCKERKLSSASSAH